MSTQHQAPDGRTGAAGGTGPGALHGLRIADFSRVLAGPYATMLLADLGADVIKVERPGTGDDTRAWHPPTDQDGTSTYFLSVNRNKRSVVLDLATEAGREQARALIAACDVVVENFRPGTMERLGLGHQELLARHPRLVYCSISGFGSGAGAAIPGYDLLVQAVGGLMSVTGTADGEPVKAGVALVDVITGLHASLGILAALRHRDATGQGQLVEVNLLGSLLSAMVNQASAYAVAGVVPGRLGNAHPSISPFVIAYRSGLAKPHPRSWTGPRTYGAQPARGTGQRWGERRTVRTATSSCRASSAAKARASSYRARGSSAGERPRCLVSRSSTG
ncbi:CoA transferase [Streptomyces lomondensis]|nr:CoA transferase [Streptomyces lomondensis]